MANLMFDNYAIMALKIGDHRGANHMSPSPKGREPRPYDREFDKRFSRLEVGQTYEFKDGNIASIRARISRFARRTGMKFKVSQTGTGAIVSRVL